MKDAEGQTVSIAMTAAGTLASTGHFTHRFLQPLDPSALPRQPAGLGPAQSPMELCIAHCLQDPRWRLSLQTHKVSGIR